MRITMPWPPRSLHPNGRVHWRVTAEAKKDQRQEAKILTQNAMQLRNMRRLKADTPVLIRYEFHCPDRHERDDDGMVSSMKGARDGVADALILGGDDHYFKNTHEFLEPVQYGRVDIVITWPGEEA